MGKNLTFLPECHSTNTLAMDFSHQGAGEGTLVITAHQISGRGQRGSTWVSDVSKNLTFSIVLKPTFLMVKDQFLLSKAIALGLLDAVRSLLPPVESKIKWPNDIMVQGKKVAGILIENQIMGTLYETAVVGIGLNVNQEAFPIPTASSLKAVAGQEFDLNHVLDEVVSGIEKRYLQLKNGGDDVLNALYQESLYWFDERRTFFANTKEFEGRIQGVDEWGRLIVLDQSRERHFDIKEILYLR